MDLPKAGDNLLRVIIRPGSPKTQIRAVDEARNALRVDVAAPPEKNKANIEIIRFFSKLLKRKIEIVSGKRSREKLLRIG